MGGDRGEKTEYGKLKNEKDAPEQAAASSGRIQAASVRILLMTRTGQALRAGPVQLVRVVGLEPTSLAALEPKSSMFTNFIIPACPQSSIADTRENGKRDHSFFAPISSQVGRKPLFRATFQEW